MYSRSEMLTNQTRYDSINRNKIFSSGKTHSEKKFANRNVNPQYWRCVTKQLPEAHIERWFVFRDANNSATARNRANEPLRN